MDAAVHDRYARLLHALGRREEADRVCRTVTAATPFGIPATAHEHYYYGFALYLLAESTLPRRRTSSRVATTLLTLVCNPVEDIHSP